MKPQNILGGLVTFLLVLISFWIVAVTPVTLFSYLPEEAKLSLVIEAPLKTAEYLWGERILDVVAQSLVILSAIISILTLLRGEKID
jgi:hypothetical protein